MAELRAHQLSTLSGSVLIELVWLLFTAGFEFFRGVVLLHRPLSGVLQKYNVVAGRVWLLFLVWLALAPWVFFRLRSAA